MTIFQAIANSQRLELIKKSCGQKTADFLDSVLQKDLAEIEQPISQVIELFSLIDEADKSNIENLPLYSVGLREVMLINNHIDLHCAMEAIRKHRIIGIDTEQKPVFKRGVPPNGIALVQIATKQACYMFQIKSIKTLNPLLDLLEEKETVKIGINLNNDKEIFLKEFGISLKSCIDLDNIFKSKLNSKNQIGAKKAVSLFLGKNIEKSRKVSLSNWERTNLTAKQIKYAAEDAFAAYDVFCSLLVNYPFTINLMPAWFQNRFHQNDFIDELYPLKTS